MPSGLAIAMCADVAVGTGDDVAVAGAGDDVAATVLVATSVVTKSTTVSEDGVCSGFCKPLAQAVAIQR